MQIKSVAVLGAGAVGSYVIWGLSSRKDIRLAVIAEGPRAERLKQQGITINGTTYRPQVWTPQETNGVDLLVVALKYGALPGACAQGLIWGIMAIGVYLTLSLIHISEPTRH